MATTPTRRRPLPITSVSEPNKKLSRPFENGTEASANGKRASKQSLVYPKVARTKGQTHFSEDKIGSSAQATPTKTPSIVIDSDSDSESSLLETISPSPSRSFSLTPATSCEPSPAHAVPNLREGYGKNQSPIVDDTVNLTRKRSIQDELGSRKSPSVSNAGKDRSNKLGQCTRFELIELV